MRLPKRPKRRARFLIVIGSSVVILAYFILVFLSQNVSHQAGYVAGIGLKIICGIDLAVLIAGTIVLFWGISVWIREKIFRS
jgi:hypothetical protein